MSQKSVNKVIKDESEYNSIILHARRITRPKQQRRIISDHGACLIDRYTEYGMTA